MQNYRHKLLKLLERLTKRPLLKAAYIDTDVFTGDDQLKVLVKLKSKEDLIGEVYHVVTITGYKDVIVH
jgi:hypothetical protein